ncbi:MAG: glutathione transport system permease protein [Frankiales bacterium]|jgi:peptide/nickel transport system permease protein|nr:glutathione transport system permease protein [Frankiales bacterium]MDX6274956.1 glutathione transport system permease protein [Frankiales bacterium]
MLAFTLRRLLIAIPILVISSFITFFLVALSGDPLGDLKTHQPPLPPSTIAAKRHLLHLDEPLFPRYWHWLTGLLHGDFGPSVKQNFNIGSQLGHRLTVTMRMVALAMLLAVIFAVIVGVISAVRQYSGLDYAFTFTGFLFLSMPSFWLAILLKEFLAIRINGWTGHTLLYTIGDSSVEDKHGLAHVQDIAGHIILPTIVLALISYASWSRFQRASMLDVLNSDYIRLARAKGLTNRRVMVRHALRTALIPLTTVTALDLAGILGGAVITERVFQWHGMGEMLINGINDRDVYVVLAWLLVTAFIVVMFNLIADLLYAVLDPRIRYA